MAEDSMPIKVFISYAHEDKRLLDELVHHLSPLKRQNKIDPWHDESIPPGSEWKREIMEPLEEAQIILLLVSSAFTSSEFCNSIEMKQALEREEKGEAIVIPIILRSTDWHEEPYGKLQWLPKSKAVMNWSRRDDAWLDVVQGIRKAINDLASKSKPLAGPSKATGTTAVGQTLGADDPDLATSLDNLADTYSKQGKNKQAEPLYQRAREIRAEHSS